MNYGFTDKELRIIEMKCEGILNKNIITELNISVGTMNFHLKNIRRKMNVTTMEHALFLFGLHFGVIVNNLNKKYDFKSMEFRLDREKRMVG